MIERMFDDDTVGEQRRAAGMARLESVRVRLRSQQRSCPPGAAAEVVEDARRAVDALGALLWADLDSEGSMASVLGLEASRRGLEARLAAGMAHLESRGATVQSSGLATNAWLAHNTHGARDTGRRSVEMGRTLDRFPGFGDAIRCGELSTDHASALAVVSNPRIVDRLIEAEPTLLEMARSVSFEAFRRNLRVIARRLDADGAEPDCGDRDEVAMGTDASGFLHLRGRFSGHNATVVERALRAETDRQRRAASDEHSAAGTTMPTPGALRARAFAQLVRNGLGRELSRDGSSSSEAPRTEAIVVMREDDHGGHTVCSIDGEPLDPETAAVLTCDAWLRPIVTDADGTPLFAGRGTRYATLAQRRALIARDGGCVFPGCDAPAAWCDAHHIVPWERNGCTDINNLALLCRRHHGLAHSGGWTLRAEPVRVQADGSAGSPGAVDLLWHTPDGRALSAQQSGRRAPPGQSRRSGPAA